MKTLFLIFLFSSMAQAGINVCHNNSGVIVEPSSSTAICVYYSIPPLSVQDYERVRMVMTTVPRKYVKWTTEPVEMNQAEKDVIDAQILIDEDILMRTGAKNEFNGNNVSGQSNRCFAKIAMDEINVIRSWIRDFKTEVAASTNLVNFQSRVSNLPTLENRTLSQIKNQIQSCIDSGDVNE